jgi:adenosine deaminase
MNHYFQRIRENSEELLEFFKKMPKGADIHHHALGALRPVDILKKATEMGLWIDVQNGQLYTEANHDSVPVAQILSNDQLTQSCLNKWSILGYDCKDDAGKYFFDVFFKISPVFNGNETYWLNKILDEAATESLLYIETLIECPDISKKIYEIAENFESDIDENATEADFKDLFSYLTVNGLEDLKNETINLCDSWIESVSDHQTLLRFQLYTVRNLSPKSVLAQLILSFSAAANSDNIVGVNLVAPEYDEFSLRYYSLHMRVCRWLSTIFPNVNLALHAGELTDKLVESEHLKFHIYEAISIAGAKRIGHGVDLMTESGRNFIFDMMSEKPVPIEILPDSNEFILAVSGEEHPFESYHRSKVPIVVASDDPGVLNSSLAAQYKKLAIDFPYLSYSDFKEFVFNSIRYSFLAPEIKEQFLLKLEHQFVDFEQSTDQK